MDNQNSSKIVEITKDLLERVGFDGEIKFINNENEQNEQSFSIVSIDSNKDLSILIGKNGQNLSAFDHIVHLVASRKLGGVWGKDLNFVVDINDYRKSKTNYLVEVARNVAKRVIQTRRAEALSPMNAYERRLVHTELASYKELQTESIGQEPRRRVVIKPQLELL